MTLQMQLYYRKIVSHIQASRVLKKHWKEANAQIASFADVFMAARLVSLRELVITRLLFHCCCCCIVGLSTQPQRSHCNLQQQQTQCNYIKTHFCSTFSFSPKKKKDVTRFIMFILIIEIFVCVSCQNTRQERKKRFIFIDGKFHRRPIHQFDSASNLHIWDLLFSAFLIGQS